MKTPMSFAWIPSLVLVIASSADSLAQRENPVSPTAPKATLTATVASPTAPGSVLPDNSRDKPLPAKLRLSPWTTEIVKLAESGIEEGVMLSFIENTGTFNLGADQIIYLSDLGISSQVISAMLQHDQEIISGARPVTISSDPPLDPIFTFALGAGSNAPSSITQSPSAPASAAMLITELTSASSAGPLTAKKAEIGDTQPALIQYAMTDESAQVKSPAFQQQRETQKQKPNLYPVREPYPVELSPPIIVFKAAERTPNTVILIGFPRTAP